MGNIYIYFSGIIITLVCCLVIIFFLRRKFYNILIELTGNQTRAEFWLFFSNVLLLLIPTVFAMFVFPDSSDLESIIFEITRQLKWGLIGLIITLIVLGFIMINFIKKYTQNRDIE